MEEQAFTVPDLLPCPFCGTAPVKAMYPANVETDTNVAGLMFGNMCRPCDYSPGGAEHREVRRCRNAPVLMNRNAKPWIGPAVCFLTGCGGGNSENGDSSSTPPTPTY